MSTSDPIAPDRLEALLRGEAGADGRERRIGALLDELTVGEIAPPAELRERVRSLSATPAVAAARAAPAAPPEPRRDGAASCRCSPAASRSPLSSRASSSRRRIPPRSAWPIRT